VQVDAFRWFQAIKPKHNCLIGLPTPSSNIQVTATVLGVHGGKGPTSTRQSL
jgi:hypothetical protein